MGNSKERKDMKVPEFRRIEMWASSIFQKTLSLISPLTTVIYYRTGITGITGITGKTDRHTHTQTDTQTESYTLSM